MKRLADRLLALAMLIVGVACLAKLYLALGDRPAPTTRHRPAGMAWCCSRGRRNSAALI